MSRAGNSVRSASQSSELARLWIVKTCAACPGASWAQFSEDDVCSSVIGVSVHRAGLCLATTKAVQLDRGDDDEEDQHHVHDSGDGSGAEDVVLMVFVHFGQVAEYAGVVNAGTGGLPVVQNGRHDHDMRAR